jgi:hypothetical protein
MRDANSSTQWTDAGGRRASLDGEILTDYVDGSSIRFLGGSHNLYALEGTSLRPNPAAWSAAITNYTDTTTALAALGGRIRGTYLLLTFDAAFIAFRNVRLDIINVLPGAVAISGGTFAANTTQSGISSAFVDVDGLELPLGFGQPIPDVLHSQLDPVVQTNASGGSISDLGGLNRRLTYTINLPNLSIDLSGSVVSASAAGLIVANATLPTVPTLTARKSGGDIVLSWPTNAVGFALEYATNLPATTWSPSFPLPVVVGEVNVVTNTMIGDAIFYRLHKQQ